MAVHMIRVWTEPPKNDNKFNQMQTTCEDWASSYAETLTTERLSLTWMLPADGVEVEHAVGHWRFEWSEDLTTLLADLEAGLQNEVSWYRIRYHSCSHDENSRTGCSWDESQTRDYGTVPGGIP